MEIVKNAKEITPKRDSDHFTRPSGRTRVTVDFPKFKYDKEKKCCVIEGLFVMTALIYIRNTNPVYMDKVTSADDNPNKKKRDVGHVPREQKWMDITKAHEVLHQNQWRKLHDDWEPKFAKFYGMEGKSASDCSDILMIYNALLKDYKETHAKVKKIQLDHSGTFLWIRKTKIDHLTGEESYDRKDDGSVKRYGWDEKGRRMK